MKHLQILATKDNSVTLYNTELNETYHSRHGAVQESMHVFIKNGLHYFTQQFPKTEIAILEIGFGTGLNALLTLIESEKINCKVNYISTEPFPIDIGIANELNYCDIMNLSENQKKYFLEMHKEKNISYENFKFKFNLIINEFMKIEFETTFDIIYFDAFAPEKQPELWTSDVFKKCNSLLNPTGVLVTYCAKGNVKRTIKACDLKLETLAGPPGKREMIRAVKY